MHNKVEDIKHICRRIAKFNGSEVSEEALAQIGELAAMIQERRSKAKTYTMLDCVRTRSLLIFTLLNCSIWYVGLHISKAHSPVRNLPEVFGNHQTSPLIRDIPSGAL